MGERKKDLGRFYGTSMRRKNATMKTVFGLSQPEGASGEDDRDDSRERSSDCSDDGGGSKGHHDDSEESAWSMRMRLGMKRTVR